MEKEKKISTSNLISLLDKYDSVDAEYYKHYLESIQVFDFILNNQVITVEDLNRFSYEQLEWAIDALRDIPLEGDNPRYFSKKPLYEYCKSQDLIGKFSKMKAVQKEILFF